jgi:hypothetical protein
MQTLRLAIPGILFSLLLPTVASASYILSVVQGGTTVLQQEIRIMPESTTIATWKSLLEYGMTPTKDAKGIPEKGKGDRLALTGKVKVHVHLSDGYGKKTDTSLGEVEIDGLNLYRGMFPATIWLIEPADAARILERRREAEKK